MSETLIVVGAYDDSFSEFTNKLGGGDVLVYDTSGGGYPTAAYIRAYRAHPEYDSYLFLQDSLEPLLDDVVAPFREPDSPVVAWGFFPFFFDNREQEYWVRAKHQGELPPVGIFGPIFYATREAMEKLDKLNRFPRTPHNKLQYCGTERSWACAFWQSEIRMAALGQWSNEVMASGDYPVFRKVFAGRE